MAETNIEWADYTFNHVRGCTKVSTECDFCYAETLSNRNPKTLGIWGKFGQRAVAADSYWKLAVKWDRWARDGVCMACKGKNIVPSKEFDWQPCKNCVGGKVEPYRARVFCASLADVFEGDSTMPEASLKPVWEARTRLFKLIQNTPHLDWLLLTKRPNFVKNIMRDLGYDDGLASFPNVWLGTSVGEKKARERIDILRDIPAAKHFLSIEPLLEDLGELDLTGIDWVICGGESGPNARPMHPDWVRSIRDQCLAVCKDCAALTATFTPSTAPGFIDDSTHWASCQRPAFFFKQWGEWAVSSTYLGYPRNMPLLKNRRTLGIDGTSPGPCWEPPPPQSVGMFKVGKKSAGRILDERTWDEMPI